MAARGKAARLGPGPQDFGAGQAITTPKGHGAGAACVEAEGEDGFTRPLPASSTPGPIT